MPKRVKKRSSNKVSSSTRARTPKWFLSLSIIISALSIIFSLFFNKLAYLALNYIFEVILIAWFVTCIVMLVKFVKRKTEKGSIWLASIYLIDFIISFLLGMFVGAWATVNNVSLDIILNSPSVIVIEIILPIVTLLIALKLYFKR